MFDFTTYEGIRAYTATMARIMGYSVRLELNDSDTGVYMGYVESPGKQVVCKMWVGPETVPDANIYLLGSYSVRRHMLDNYGIDVPFQRGEVKQ